MDSNARYFQFWWRNIFFCNSINYINQHATLKSMNTFKIISWKCQVFGDADISFSLRFCVSNIFWPFFIYLFFSNWARVCHVIWRLDRIMYMSTNEYTQGMDYMNLNILVQSTCIEYIHLHSVNDNRVIQLYRKLVPSHHVPNLMKLQTTCRYIIFEYNDYTCFHSVSV